MGNLKPIGSEKLTGDQKLKRIMEIARFNEVIPNRINETAKSEYGIGLADGNRYEIIKERQGYIIKKTISESETDYIEPMKNRKYYSSYSQALKRLNLVAGELNRLNENEEGVSLYGEQKKFTLKTPQPKIDVPAPVEAPPAPPSVPSPELTPSPVGDTGLEDDEMGMDDEMEMDDEMGMDDEMEMDDTESDDSNDTVTFKSIQKLTGKLTQKIRTLESQEGITSEDIKYVINMVLSSFDLNELNEEDREDILSKFEDVDDDLGGDDLGGDDMDGEDLTDDSEVEDIQADMDIPMEGDMEEGYEYDDVDEEEWLFSKRSEDDDFEDSFEQEWLDSLNNQMGDEDYEFELNRKNRKDNEHPLNIKPKKSMKKFGDYGGDNSESYKFSKFKKTNSNLGNGAIFDSIFGESKVDKVLTKYFEVSKKEIVENRQKSIERKTKIITEVRRQMKSVVKLTETIEQELASQKFLEENIGAKIIGKTNKNNLVFHNKGKEIKITPEGLLV